MRGVRQIDYVISVSIFILIVFGIAMLSSASSDLGKLKFDDAYYYLKHQALYGLSLGIVGFLAGLYVPFGYYKKFAPVLLILSLGALILVFTPYGVTSGGAQRWIQLGPVTIQPAEILKLTFIIYLAAWLSSSRRDRQHGLLEGFLPFLAVSGIIGVLLLLQKSTSAVVIIMLTALGTYFVGGAKKIYILYAVLLGAAVLAGVIYFTPYRLDRVKTFFEPTQDSQNAGYQLNQSLITIGSGGIFGVGYGKSVSKVYLPEKIGDSIFAVIAEEFGFLGSIVLIGTFFAIVFQGYRLAKRTGDKFGKLLLVGFSTIIGVQAFIHIASTSGLIPLTGVPLPFISYGGTALAVFMTMSGIMLNLGKNA
ncbi:MAG: cell division protein FtsW [Candidatus Colwellbacteria bacterium]|nr:cell division protein FtsW [Candidatus Colwellbacteria bacterium]